MPKSLEDFLYFPKLMEEYNPYIVEVSPYYLVIFKDYFMDLFDMVGSHQGLNDLYPVLLEAAIVDGELKTFPFTYQLMLMYYNKEVFDLNGIAYPSDGWTWQELSVIVERLEAANQRENFTAIHPLSWTSDLEAIVMSNGGNMLSPTNLRAEGYLNSPATIEAIEWWVTQARDIECVCWYDSLVDGELGMMLGQSFHYLHQNFREDILFNENIGKVGMPIFEGNTPSTPLTMTGLSIVEGSENVDVAWEFMNYSLIQEHEISDQMALDYFYSTRRSVTSSSGLDNIPAGQEIMKALKYAQPTTITNSVVIPGNNIFDLQNREFLIELYEGDIRLILERFAQEWDSILAELENY